MNAKRRTLAVLAAVIAVLGLALWALNRSTAAEEVASSAAADGTIPLCSFSAADLSRITYTYNGQTLTLDDADGSWTLAEDADYHLDESVCNTMVTALSSLHAKRQLDAQAGEDYGFDAPELTVTVTAAGQTTTLTFGSSNTVTGDRYVQKDGDTALYTVDASRTACFACDKAGLFGSFSPAGFAASDVEQVAYTLASGEKVSLTAGSELAGDGVTRRPWGRSAVRRFRAGRGRRRSRFGFLRDGVALCRRCRHGPGSGQGAEHALGPEQLCVRPDHPRRRRGPGGLRL